MRLAVALIDFQHREVTLIVIAIKAAYFNALESKDDFSASVS
jgi:hypothetical protein